MITALELLSAEEMQAVDRQAAVDGLDTYQLMRSAGESVAKTILSGAPEHQPLSVLILAGPGNNGGDGLVAASYLYQRGVDTEVWLLKGASRNDDSKARKSDAQRALENCQAPIAPLQQSVLTPAQLQRLQQANVVVDALFGAGLSGPLSGIAAELVQAVNQTDAWVVAVDVPSGLDGNRHDLSGVAIEADKTVTFFRYKPCHFLYPGKRLCGSTQLEQIGLSEQQLSAVQPACRLNAPEGFTSDLPQLQSDGHKYHRGHVLVRSGPLQATGAARLSADMALKAGAGLVTLATSPEALSVNAAHVTAIMLAVCESVQAWQSLLDDRRFNTVVIGPGNGVNEDTRQATMSALESHKLCVLDADALSVWSTQQQHEQFFQALQAAKKMAVLTPHSGEFSRLFPDICAPAWPSKLHQAREASHRTGSVIVFKGADTVIAEPGGRAVINHNAPPWLGTAGAGDVLAGLIGSLMAQGMPVFGAASAAVWLHAEAARQLTYPMTAEALAEPIARELSRISPVNRHNQRDG